MILKIERVVNMKTAKEFFNKLRSENRNIEVDYNDMDIIIIKDDSIVGQVMLYDYDNDCEHINENIELSFEDLTITILKFKNISCIKETVLNFANDNEVMKELKHMEII